MHLLKVTNCSKFFFGEERQARVLEIQALSQDLEVFQVPTTKSLLNDEGGLHHYAHTKAYAEAEDDVVFIIHSSGTTG